MSQTFLALKTKLNQRIWPNGVPENVTAQIAQMYQSAMGDIYRHNDCLKQANVTVYKQCGTYFKCGTTVIGDRPVGVVKRVYTLRPGSDGDSDCFAIALRPSTMADIRGWTNGLVSNYVNQPDEDGLPSLPLGYRYPNQSTDSAFGRSLCGLWAIDQSRLVVAPWIQSDESLVVEWQGKKTSWADTDLMLDDIQFEDAVKAYVQMAHAKDFGCDQLRLQIFTAAFADANGNILFDCREELRQQPEEEIHPSEASVRFKRWRIIDSGVPDDESATPFVFAAVGDFGSAGTPELNVSTLIKSWSPSLVLALGDNNYPSGEAATIDANIGQYYAKFIYPYTGSYPLLSGETAATTNQFWPVMGNHDLDTVVSSLPGKPLTDYISAMDADVYDFVSGNVHFFALNSGFNTAGTAVGFMGNNQNSPMAFEVARRVAQSTSRWKVVMMHHPYKTSGSGYAPGHKELSWVEDLPVDAVFCGHAHSFEAIQPAGKPALFISGNGGHSLVAKSATVDVDETFFSSADYGALKVTVLCDSFQVEFITRTGSVLKTVTLTK